MDNHNLANQFKTGDIILLNRKGKSSSWFSVLQRFFTKMPYTHTAIIAGAFKNTMTVFSADELNLLLPLEKYFDEEGTDIEIFSVNTNLDVDKILEEMFIQYSGAYYGFTQILWFLYRWFMETFFKKDVRKQKNPLRTGVVCSELAWYFLKYIAEEQPLLKEKMNEWTADTINSGDFANLCKSLPSIFQLKYKKFNQE